MDKGIKAAQTQVARERIRAATLALVERHGLDTHAEAMAAADGAPVSVRDLRQLEAVADLLEGLAAVPVAKTVPVAAKTTDKPSAAKRPS